MVLAPVQSRADGVAPPLKRECTHGDHVAVSHSRASEKSLHPEFAQAVNNLSESFVVSEVLKTYGSRGGTPLDNPSVLALALDGDLIG